MKHLILHANGQCCFCGILYQFCDENLNEKFFRFFKFFSENRGIAWLNKSATVASLLRIIGKDL
jgi:hypothetical protein